MTGKQEATPTLSAEMKQHYHEFEHGMEGFIKSLRSGSIESSLNAALKEFGAMMKGTMHDVAENANLNHGINGLASKVAEQGFKR